MIDEKTVYRLYKLIQNIKYYEELREFAETNLSEISSKDNPNECNISVIFYSGKESDFNLKPLIAFKTMEFIKNYTEKLIKNLEEYKKTIDVDYGGLSVVELNKLVETEDD